MSFYDYDTEQINEELLPPQLRQPIHKAWLKVLLHPLQWVRDVFFDSYIAGSAATNWQSGTPYAAGSRKVRNNAVYESVVFSLAKNPEKYPDVWVKLQDCFIGVDERLKYKAQIIVFEYALNRWFRNTAATDQIYIENNVTDSDFFLVGESDILSSTVSTSDLFATDFVGQDYTPGTQYDYTIWFPVALYNSLGSNAINRENAVRQIANKYNMAGMAYNIDTF